MLYGMTYQQYRHASIDELEAYKALHRLKIDQHNEEMWLQGLYVYDAVNVVLSNAFRKKGAKANKYLDKPLELFPKSEEEKAEQRKKAQEQITNQLTYLKENWSRLYGNQN